jgi:putative FmdB family regulatory protein
MNGEQKGGLTVPIYAYRCESCGNEFDVFCKTFEVKEEMCPECGGRNTKRLLTPPLIRMEKASEPTTEFARKEEPIEYYRKKGRFDLAAKEAEKAGKSEWEVKRIRGGKKF